MKAVILEHPRDLRKFNLNDKSLNFYAFNFYTYQKLKNYKKIKYINNQKILSKYDKFSEKIVRDWFLKNREKNLKNNKISIGHIILPRLLNEFSNSLKNYLIIKKILSNNSLILIPKNKKFFVGNFIKLIPNKVKFYDSKNKIQDILSADQIKSKIIPLPQIHILSGIARFIQKIFYFNNKNKIIYYPDPRTKFFFEKFNNILFLNSLKFWKSFYFKYSLKYLKEAQLLIDLDYHQDLDNYLRLNRSKRNETYLDIFKSSLNKVVKKSKKNILRTLSIYIELFEYYCPKSIIFPGILNFDYAAAIEICKIKKIKTYIATDGVLINYNETEFNKNHIFDKVIAWGEQHKIMLKKLKIKEKNIILTSPFYKKIRRDSLFKKKYIIVLPLLHYTQKLSSHPDKNIYHTLSVLKVLNKMKKKNIILKIKGGNYDTNKTVDIYHELIKFYGLKNISISTKKMENYLTRAKLIIGQCSSTIYEAVKNNISYHIYEPYDLGLSNQEIKKSNLYNRKKISRNEIELYRNLKKKNKSSIIKTNKQIFKGLKLNKNFFNV